MAAAAVVIGLGKDELFVELFMLELFGFEKNSPKDAGFKERRRWEGGEVDVGESARSLDMTIEDDQKQMNSRDRVTSFQNVG